MRKKLTRKKRLRLRSNKDSCLHAGQPRRIGRLLRMPRRRRALRRARHRRRRRRTQLLPPRAQVRLRDRLGRGSSKVRGCSKIRVCSKVRVCSRVREYSKVTG